MYYLDARKDSVIDVRSEMLKVLYSIRENPKYNDDKFNVIISDVKSYVAPSFKEYQDRFELVACANPHHQNKVYVITAPITIAKEYLNDVSRKILTAYLFLFIPFFFFGYLFARIALVPVKNAYDSLVSFNEDIIHDLKTPITTIQINGELLDAQASKPFTRVVNATKTLQSLYFNLESYLRTGQHLSYEKINIYSLIYERKEVYDTLYQNAQFSYDITPFYIETDKTSIIRIIDNIVANAIKHGARFPKVEIKTINHHLHISDNGSGIDHPEKIFDRHYCEVPYIKGYGLGLNIVKRLSEQLKIPIKITSTKQGTTFELKLA